MNKFPEGKKKKKIKNQASLQLHSSSPLGSPSTQAPHSESHLEAGKDKKGAGRKELEDLLPDEPSEMQGWGEIPSRAQRGQEIVALKPSNAMCLAQAPKEKSFQISGGISPQRKN